MRSLFLFLFLPFCLSAQSSYFQKVFGTAGNDVSRSVKQLSTGSIFALGSSDTLNGGDVALSKSDRNGNLLWIKYYGTPNTDNGFFLNLTSDGNLVFTAETEAAPGNLDIAVYKVDTSGNVIWRNVYATPVNETPRNIEQTNDGGFIISGSQNDAFGLYDLLALKLDDAGNYEWSQTYGRNENDYATMIHQQGSGYILTGDTRSFGAGGYDVILFRLDALGNELWSQTYGDTLNNGSQGVLLTSDNNYLSYGETEIAPASAFDFFLQKIDTNGVSIWRHIYGGTGTDAVFSVKEDTDGGFVCTGYSNSYNGLAPLDLVIFKVDAAGNFLWQQTYGGSGIDIGYELIPSVDNDGFIIAGKTFTTSDDHYLLKLDRNGIISGIDDPKAFADNVFNLYPNPARDLITVNYKLTGAKNAKLILHDLAGKKVAEEMMTSPEGTVKINLSGLKAGVCFCSLMKGDRVVEVKKIIILP